VSIRGYVRDVLSDCPGVNQLPYYIVVQIAEAIIALAREASIKKLRGPIADLYSPGTDLAKVMDDQLLAGKRISKADVLAVIDHFKNNGSSYEDLDLTSLITPSDAPSDLVQAIRKLAKGCVETARVINIKDFVRSFEALFIRWTRKYGAEEAKRRYNNVLGIVQFETTEAQVFAARTGEPYGSEMYAGLVHRLQARLRRDADQLYDCRPEHLLGAAGLLTQQCKTWWSPIFDVSREAT
jgi:hypothetical protein